MNKKIIFGVSFDILIISISFYFSSIISNTDISNAYITLGLMTSIKVITYFIFNSYRKSWRYISIADVNPYFVSGLIASVLSYIIVINLQQEFEIKGFFFIIDFFLTFFGVLFLRVVFKYIRETVLRYRTYQKRAIIYGAGELGNLLCRQLFISQKLKIKPVGFIDDDSSIRNTFFNGIEVLGNNKDILSVCKNSNIHMVIVASEEITNQQVNKLKEQLESEGIEVKRFKLDLI